MSKRVSERVYSVRTCGSRSSQGYGAIESLSSGLNFLLVFAVIIQQFKFANQLAVFHKPDGGRM